jgi:hypothetical protein
MAPRDFPQIGTEFLRGLADPTDHGYIIPAMGHKNPGPTPNLRGVEQNTARGVKAPVELKYIVTIEYAPATDAPEVIPFKVHGEN